MLGPDGGNSLRYTGREDDNTGLYHYRARYYDPVAKRFISEDPIGIDGGINLYAYVSDNPISFIDPSGLLIGLHALQRGETDMSTGIPSDPIVTATQVGAITNDAMTVGLVPPIAAAGAAGAVVAAPTVVTATGSLIVRAATSTGVVARVTASLIQAASVAQQATKIPVQQGLGGSAPASQSATAAAAAAAARAAQQAAKNNPRIGRPTIPGLPVIGGPGVGGVTIGGVTIGGVYYPCP